ncbi:hypothetical protein PN441_17905 [Spirulina major CS-329]|nr:MULTISPECIES: hypothetical protein [Spirulina]MDB9493089.1 hypothetical protein [Spirulina subsalsa CS-330]MDB9504956.1 hypothetical protein [Spirulina major CS-329]
MSLWHFHHEWAFAPKPHRKTHRCGVGGGGGALGLMGLGVRSR